MKIIHSTIQQINILIIFNLSFNFKYYYIIIIIQQINILIIFNLKYSYIIIIGCLFLLNYIIYSV